MKHLKRLLRGLARQFQNVHRDPRYIVVLLWAVPLFLLTMVQALNAGWFDSIEKPVFHFFNQLPGFLSVPFYIATQFGSFGSVALWFAAAWYLVSRRAAFVLLVGGFLAWLGAKIAKSYVHRGRPQSFLHHINLFHNHMYTGYGFPSGHSTFSAACATILYYQLKPSQRKYLLGIVLAVGMSRMFLGAHFPLDVVGGWALGASIGAVVSLVAGSVPRAISARTVKRFLNRQGMELRSVHFLNVDARGSRPLRLETSDGQEYFGKIFGKQEHAADWLFKLYRFFRYKNLQAEEPYVNPRRNVEMESFANMWAKKTGVRTPDVCGLYKLGESWLLLQERIPAKPLPDYQRLNQKTLEDAWRQVRKLHDGNMAHRDLRAANLMVDAKGQAWLIDFGFAEVAPNRQRKAMDVAELLMSMALLVGPERTVQAAHKMLGDDRLKQALPYLQKSVFSGATTSLLRKQKQTLPELQKQLADVLNLSTEVRPANIDRINAKKALTFALLALFFYLIVPQFKQFSGNLDLLDNLRYGWVALAVLFSALTYVAAGAVYLALANVPLRLRDASLIQLASSFVTKIIPGGLGSTTLNARYLTRTGLEPAEASALISGQSLIGFVWFIIPLGLFLLFAGHSLHELIHIHVAARWVYVVVVLLVVGAVILAFSRKLRHRLTEFLTQLIQNLRDLSSSPRELSLASLASFAVTTCYIGCLYASMLAFHVHLSLAAAILIYASAMIAKSAIPTPGGLGPVEVTMAAALVGYGIEAAPAYAVVVLYRLVTFWIPVPFSVLAYRYATSKRLI